MPSRPPKMLMRAVDRPSNWSKHRSRHDRGYGRAHDLMRERVMREEPLCRACAAAGKVAATTTADHVVPKSEGGSDDRSNYQGLCTPCHRAKTAAEAARSRAAARRRTR